MNRLCVLLVLLFFFVASSVLAGNFKSPHKLKPGQTLSADVLNEIIDALSFSEKIPTRDDFLGTWSCVKALPANSNIYNSTNYPNHTFNVEQVIIYTISGTLEFEKDGSGNYLLTDPNKILRLSDEIVESPYGTMEGNFFYKLSNLDLVQTAPVVFRGNNQFLLTQQGAFVTMCNKNNIPPEIPEDTNISVSGSSATIIWVDRSEGETGFIVVRRDNLNSQWIEIATVGPVTGSGTTVNYTDTGLSPGTYWFRVKSVNNHGKSLGSNVVKIDIQ